MNVLYIEIIYYKLQLVQLFCTEEIEPAGQSEVFTAAHNELLPCHIRFVLHNSVFCCCPFEVHSSNLWKIAQHEICKYLLRPTKSGEREGLVKAGMGSGAFRSIQVITETTVHVEDQITPRFTPWLVFDQVCKVLQESTPSLPGLFRCMLENINYYFILRHLYK